jgi:hypothetical protein
MTKTREYNDSHPAPNAWLGLCTVTLLAGATIWGAAVIVMWALR